VREKQKQKKQEFKAENVRDLHFLNFRKVYLGCNGCEKVVESGIAMSYYPRRKSTLGTIQQKLWHIH
jgi:hypothetical protein